MIDHVVRVTATKPRPSSSVPPMVSRRRRDVAVELSQTNAHWRMVSARTDGSVCVWLENTAPSGEIHLRISSKARRRLKKTMLHEIVCHRAENMALNGETAEIIARLTINISD